MRLHIIDPSVFRKGFFFPLQHLECVSGQQSNALLVRDLIESPNNSAAFHSFLSSTTTPQGTYRFSSECSLCYPWNPCLV